MSMLLNSARPGAYTVRRVTGGRKIAIELENIGIASGADVRILDSAGDGFEVETAGGRKITISPDKAKCIQLSEQFKRGDCDPVFFSCCMYGNTVELMKIADRVNAENRQKCMEKQQK